MSAASTVPGSSQPVSLVPDPDPGTGTPYLPEQPAQPASEPAIPEPVQQELTQLRAMREQVAPIMPLVEQLGGDGLYQHYANYAEMLQRQQQPQQPTQEPARQPDADPWGDPAQPDPHVQALQTEIQGLKGQLQQVTRNVGVDKVAAHSAKFFGEEFPDLTPAERSTINEGMGRVFKGYAAEGNESGNAFLQNPQYEAVRALAINQMGPQLLEEVYRRKFEREREGRSRLSTDAYRTTSPATEDVDFGDSFVSAWEAAGEKVRREGGR
jgi:hypothetical protein